MKKLKTLVISIVIGIVVFYLGMYISDTFGNYTIDTKLMSVLKGDEIRIYQIQTMLWKVVFAILYLSAVVVAMGYYLIRVIKDRFPDKKDIKKDIQ